MRVAIIGRTRALLSTAEVLMARGHEVPLIWTCREETHYDAGRDDFALLAERCGAAFHDDLTLGRDESVARLRATRCDIGVSVNWMTLVSPEVIEEFPLGLLNAHAGDLPRFRGNACTNWAILANEPHVGLCVHQMVAELDAGPVVCRDRFPLGRDTYIGDVHAWLDVRIPELFAEAVDGLASGRLVPEAQSADPSDALRGYPRRPDDSKLDWSWPVERVYRMVRASSRPFSGAFTTLEGARKVVLWRAAPHPVPGPFLAVPGQVCLRAGDDPVIACADGMLRLLEVEVEGCRDPREAKSLIHRSLRNRLV